MRLSGSDAGFYKMRFGGRFVAEKRKIKPLRDLPDIDICALE
jgi:hypothetical protein